MSLRQILSDFAPGEGLDKPKRPEQKAKHCMQCSATLLMLYALLLQCNAKHTVCETNSLSLQSYYALKTRQREQIMPISNEDIALSLYAVLNAIEKLSYNDNKNQLSKIVGDERRRLEQKLNIPPSDRKSKHNAPQHQNPTQYQQPNPWDNPTPQQQYQPPQSKPYRHPHDPRQEETWKRLHKGNGHDQNL